MKKSFANKLSRLLPGVALVASALTAPLASAGPAMGFNPFGTGAAGPGYTYSDLWTNVTDSALSIGFVPATLANPNPVVLGNPATYYNTDLVAQARVGSMSLLSTVNTAAGMNVANGNAIAGLLDANSIPRFELTKVLRIQETVIQQSLLTAQFIAGSSQPNISTSLPNQQLEIYFDRLNDGTEAVPGNAAGTVRCYGAGSTSTANTNCTNPGAGKSDGVKILSAHLVSATSSFAVDPTNFSLGTGSFDLRFVIDYVDSSYLDVTVGSIFGDKLTGTVNVPSLFTPAQMWDGTATGTGLLLKVDSSESFINVPEPGSLALVGISLLGTGLALRRRRAA